MARLTEAGARDDGSSPLLRAVDARDLGEVRSLLAGGADVKFVAPGGKTALHFAAESGDAEVARLLLDAGADLHAADANELTPLHLASGRPVTELLLDRGASTAPTTQHHRTPFLAAVERGQTDTLAVFVDRGVGLSDDERSEWPPVIVAAFFGHGDTIRFLRQHGFDVNERLPWLNETALVVVASGALGDMAVKATPETMVEIAKDLIAAGADVNARANLGFHTGATPLHGAALRGDPAMVSLLLDHGADATARGEGRDGRFVGYTPLHDAALGGHVDAARVLLERGADINARSGVGAKGVQTPLDVTRSLEMVAFLQGRGGVRVATKP